MYTKERIGTRMGRKIKESKTVCIRLEKNIYDQLIITSKQEGRTNTKIIEEHRAHSPSIMQSI